MTKENDFGAEKFRMRQDFHELAGVKKVLVTVPVRKPLRQVFVRTHPSESMRFETAVVEFKEENETYLVEPELWSELPGEITPKLLITTIDRQNNVCLWPIRLPDQMGRIDEWNRSAMEAARIAQTQWIRLVSNRSLGCYEINVATGDLPEPDWPEKTFDELLTIAFPNHRIIDSSDHPVVRRLRGNE
jgi:hypothetical protein